MLTLCLTDSLEKIFPDEAPRRTLSDTPCALRNEVYAFQAAYRFEQPAGEPVCVRINSPLGAAIHVREVGLIPSELPVHTFNDDYVLRRMPGLFPDLLRPLDDGVVPVLAGQWRALWITVNPDSAFPAGDYPIEVIFSKKSGEELGRASTTLRLLSALLPDQRLIHTQWFHCDGISGYYNVPVFSDRFWTLVERFMKTAASRGINMLLTPVLTPPLDTTPGGERETVQLVNIVREKGRYTFRFDRLRRWISLCRKTGVKYLEINHMFTQWGAQHAPKVMARDGENGPEVRIFGWETDAAGPEYRAFLEQLIPALLTVLREEGMDRHSYFHVSDEPGGAHIEQYKRVSEHFRRLVEGYPVMDALSDFAFYSTGAVPLPIPATNHIEPFLEARVPGLWTYYCVSQYNGVANRFFGMPSARNRVLGVQLYKFEIAGFLQWGYNFYNAQYSRTKINPFCVTDAGRAFPSGDAFSVYPGPDGPWSSLRLEVFYEGLQDMRALELAQTLVGRDAVLALLEEGLDAPLSFSSYPHDDEWLLGLRARLNALIAAHCPA